MKLNTWQKVALGAVAAGAAAVSPIIPQEMKWVVSYETVAFQTIDGDLDFDQYAIGNDEGEYYIREVPKDVGQFTSTTSPDAIKGKQLVEIAGQRTGFEDYCGSCAYYSEFLDKKGNTIRVREEKESYDSLKFIKNYPQPKKSELVPLIEPGIAEAAVQVVATTSTGRVSNSSGQSFSHTVSGSDTLLFVLVTQNDTTATDRDISAATYNGDALTIDYENTTGSVLELHVLYRVAPDAGSNTVSLTYGGVNGSANTAAISFENVRQTAVTNLPTNGGMTGGWGTYSPVDGSLSLGFGVVNSNSAACVPDGDGVEQWAAPSGTGAISFYGQTIENMTAGQIGDMDWACSAASSPNTRAYTFAPSCDPSSESCTDTFLYFDAENNESVTITPNWTVPAGITSAVGSCWGAGGGGGSVSASAGGGGGGGAYASSNLTLTPGNTYTWTVNSGSTQEVAGTDSQFDDGSVLLADGGGTTNTATAATGGSTANSVGNIVEYAGGDGGAGDNTNDAGGGGGGAAGPSGAGNTGTAGTTVGGNGGSGNAGSGGAGGNGGNAAGGDPGGTSFLGGGGGGGADDGINCSSPSACYGGYIGGGGGGAETSGGRGAAGMCTVVYGSGGGGDPAASPANLYIKNGSFYIKNGGLYNRN